MGEECEKDTFSTSLVHERNSTVEETLSTKTDTVISLDNGSNSPSQLNIESASKVISKLSCNEVDPSKLVTETDIANSQLSSKQDTENILNTLLTNSSQKTTTGNNPELPKEGMEEINIKSNGHQAEDASASDNKPIASTFSPEAAPRIPLEVPSESSTCFSRQRTKSVTENFGIPLTQSTRFRNYVGCSHMSNYSITRKLGEGTFGEVHKGVHLNTNKAVALKRILMHNEKEGLPITALREIKILKALSHVNILSLFDMIYVKADSTSSSSALYMVTPYMDHDLSGLLDNPKVKFTLPQIKCYMKQLLEGVFYLHANNILHRDIKTSNILVDNEGILKLADFGLARACMSPGAQYTSSVVTRWYRPPELLLGEKKYTAAIDLWGVGCVFGQLLQAKPLLPGNSDLEQLDLVFRLCGSPNEETMPGFRRLPGSDTFEKFPVYKRRIKEQFSSCDEHTIDLLDKFLLLDPKTRITADDALSHLFFYLDPLPALPSSLPAYDSSHEYDRRGSKGDHRNPRIDHKKELPPHLQPDRHRTGSGSSGRRPHDISRFDNSKRFHGGNGWRRSGTGRDQQWDIDSRSGFDGRRNERRDSLPRKYPDANYRH